MSYNYEFVSFVHPIRIIRMAKILYLCGKDMAQKRHLHHWDNSKLKTLVIVLYGLLKNKSYLIYEKKAIATFSVKKQGDALHFGKLATLPEYAGKGVGSWCMNEIERIARRKGCLSVTMEVYDQSAHAKDFYLHRGYVMCCRVETRKYTEYKMKKVLNEKYELKKYPKE